MAILATAILAGIAASASALTPPAGTFIENKATATYSAANGYVFPQTTSNSVRTPVGGAPRLRLVKSADFYPVAPGALLTYTLRYENTGNETATGVAVVDTLPKGVVFQSASAGGSYSLLNHTVTWNRGVLAPGTSGVLTVTVQVQAGLAVGASIVNAASITSLEGAGAATSLSTTIGIGANLVLEKRAVSPTVTAGGVIHYTLFYRNTGNQTARMVRIIDPIPSGTAYVAGSATAGASLDNNILTWNIGDVPAGGQGTVGFQVRVSPLAMVGQQITNIATIISADQTKPSNSLFTAVSNASLLMLMVDNPDPVRAGANLTYSLQLENTGAVRLTDVVLNNPLPAGVTFVSADNGGILAVGGTQVDWAIGNLEVGQRKTITLIVQTDRTLSEGHLIENSVTARTGEIASQTVRTVTSVSARTPGTVAFFDAAWNPVYGYMSGDAVYLQVTDRDRNMDPLLAETVTVDLADAKSGDGETLVLTETGPDTGIFRSVGVGTTLAATPPGDGNLTVSSNSRIQATYGDPLDAAPAATASALIDPLGIVFDSATGNAIAGAVVTLRKWDQAANACDLASWPLLPPGQVNPAAPTGVDGRFAFPLVPAGDFCFQVTPPKGFTFPSMAVNADLPAGFTIGNGSRGERFTLSVGDPPLIRDIPLDPPAGRLRMAKSVNKTAAVIGDLIIYSLKLTNIGASPVTAITITDVMPHGIHFIPGSARLDGAVLADPAFAGTRAFSWNLAGLAPGKSLELTYRAVVGPGAPRGTGVNTASAAGASLGKPAASNLASVKLRITAGIFTEKGTILGKIFLDRDGNRRQNQGDGAKTGKLAEPGIPGVSLYLQDGTRVVTDQNGNFSLVGIAPGAHVLRVDETTLPGGLTLVPLSNRFLGDGASQFVVMQRGGLVQADFAVRGEWTPPAQPARSPTPGGASAGRGGAVALGVKAPVPAPEKSPVAKTDAGETTLKVLSGDVAEPSVPAASGGETDMSPTDLPSSVEGGEEAEGDLQAEARAQNQAAVSSPPEGQAVVDVLSSVDSAAFSTTVRDWEEEIRTMTPELAFLSPTDGVALTQDRIRVLLKAPMGTELTLTLNGVPVSAKQIGRRIEYAGGRVAIVEYVGIHLNAGEKNVLQAETKDPFGNVRGTKRISVTAAGVPERIVIRTDKMEVPADGQSQIRVTLEVRDRLGQIVPYATYATVSTSAGQIREDDADPATEEHQIILRKGVGSFTILAPRKTGEAVIAAAINDRRQEEKVFFSPHLRSLFLVGMGEVKFGLGRASGAYSFLRDHAWFDDGGYVDGRGAFFLKGRVFGDFLLTAAFDSGKDKRDDLFRENDTTPDREDRYPTYGDESKTAFEALSAERLYVKLERNRSYLLYGDFRTDFNETSLAAYNRSFTGLRMAITTPRLEVRAFGSRTDRTQMVDALRGRGISGYYYLTMRPVVEGSERVVLEIRDRNRPDRVLERRIKGRGGDYEIDYDLGTILFREPIPSHSSDYNPVYIIVSYESRSEREKYHIYGGRGAFRVLDWLEIGATGVVEEKEIGNYHLLGADMTLRLPRKTLFRAEYAQTKGIFEEEALFNWRSDDGWALTFKSEPMEKLLLSGYYRSLGEYFLNPSATDVSRGTTKYGFDAAYQLRPMTQIRGRFFNERDDLNLVSHRFAAMALQTQFKKTKIEVQISNESSSETYVPVTTSRSPFDVSQDIPRELTAARIALETELRPDLSLMLSHKHNLTGDDFHMTQGGLNFQLNSRNRLYLRQEYQQYREREELRTLFGVETQVIRNTTAFNEFRLADGADGARNQSVLGLRNKFSLGRGITGSASGEYLRTLSGSQRANEPDSLAGALALEYLNREGVRATGRIEHRRELMDAGRESFLAEVGLAYRLHPDFSLLLRERFFHEAGGLGGERTISRTMIGLAYRPLAENRFNALGKVEYKYESNSVTTPFFKEEAWIISLEGVWQATPRLQLAGKYAGKLARNGDFESYTDLLSARFLYDLTDRWDVGAEFRILTSHKVNSRLQGGAVELGYRVVKNLWAAVGYSFDRFDADLTGDSYQGKGPYFKLRFKFNEGALRFLRG